jgi:hypothetical protein
MPRRKLNRFAVVLDMHMAASGHTEASLLTAVHEKPCHNAIYALRNWRTGQTRPRVGKYLDLLEKVEKHFGQPEGRLAYMVGIRGTKLYRSIKNAYATHLQTVRWHLPDDFDQRSEAERREILSWISRNILPGSTEYGKYQSSNSRTKFSVVFPTLPRRLGGRAWMGAVWNKFPSGCTVRAPKQLVREIRNLLAFKTALLPPKGFKRARRWAETTAQAQIARYGTVLGLFAAATDSGVRGLEVPVANLTLGLFVFPEIWEWYLQWYERKRGFFSSSEQSVLYEVKALTRKQTGWIRQHPELSDRLKPIEGIVTAADIKLARSDWAAACDRAFDHACERITQLLPVSRVHRDPFEPILPVLTAASPLREYKKVGEEILRHMPKHRQHPMEAATAVRTYLMFRFAVHLGLRQRNMRELLLCAPGQKPRETRVLETLKRGELRWQPDNKTWFVFLPAVAIKNGRSAFFKGRPFEMTLPNLANLYQWITRYLEKHRSQLLNGVRDPGTFFVRTLRDTDVDPEMDTHTFYYCWKNMIERYGIYNPYTNRGAIKGLFPHGPHAVRDVLATHLVKTTGSYELASFAIQDSVEAVIRHYARFLPHEKIARAQEELNKVWRR